MERLAKAVWAGGEVKSPPSVDDEAIGFQKRADKALAPLRALLKAATDVVGDVAMGPALKAVYDLESELRGVSYRYVEKRARKQ